MLLISADLDELIGLSDRIEVILRGELVGDVRPADRHAAGPRGRDDRGPVDEEAALNAAAVARKVGQALLAPLIAVVVAVIVTSVVVVVAGASVSDFWSVS